jgi:hypothetical protein
MSERGHLPLDESPILDRVRDLENEPATRGVTQVEVLIAVAGELPYLCFEAVVTRREVLRLIGSKPGNDGA